MAEKEQGDGPSLELPSFGLRRRRPAAEPEARSEPAAAEEPQVTGETTTVAQPAPDPDPAPEPEPQPFFASSVAPGDEQPGPARPRRRWLQKPELPAALALPAAMLTGAAVGLLLVLLTWLALQTCDVVRGTSSCQGTGVALWLGILVVTVLAGRFLLAWFSLPEPGSTSFLAIGLIAVVALLFLSNALDSGWMALVLPGLGAAAYGLSQWVTTAFVEPTGREAHR